MMGSDTGSQTGIAARVARPGFDEAIGKERNAYYGAPMRRRARGAAGRVREIVEAS